MNEQFRVVVSDALDNPEVASQDLFFVIERTQLHRTQPLAVPCMKELVAHQLEPRHVAWVRARGPTSGHEERRVLVLEAASRNQTGDGREHIHEDVTIIRERTPHLRSEERRVGKECRSRWSK